MTAIAGEFRLGPDTGRLLVKTARAGLAAKVGHDLTIEVTRWSARVTVPAEEEGGMAAATISAEADLTSLVTRDGTGGARPLTEADRGEIDKTARRILAGGGPATFVSSRISASPGGGEVAGTLTIKGVARPFLLQVTEQEAGRYRGTGTVRQSGYGIKPYTAFLGALRLQDEVGLEVESGLGGAGGAGRPEPG